MISLLSKDSQESSPAPEFKSINSSVLNLLDGPTLTSVHDYWTIDYFRKNVYILVGMQRCLTVVLVHTSLMTNDVEHLILPLLVVFSPS